MKAINKYILFFSVFMTAILGCDKDIPVTDVYDFTIEESHLEESVINLGEKTTFTITPKKTVSTNVFTFSYEVLSGDGAYFKNDEQLAENAVITLQELTSDFEYKSSSLGEEKVRVTIVNSGEITRQVDVIYQIEHNEFKLEASTPIEDINMNELKNVSVSLFNEGRDDSVTYKRSFFIIQGEGELYNDNGLELIELEALEDFAEGSQNFKIKFTDFGSSKLLVRVEDSNGQIKEEEVIFNVLEVPLFFDVTTSANLVFVNQSYTYNFNIPPGQGTGPENKIRYVVEQGNAPVISYNGQTIEPNEVIDVPLSGNFMFDGVASTEQTLVVRFFLENNGTEVSERVAINVQSGDFTFEAIPNSLFGTVNQPMPFNGLIKVNGPQRRPYTLIYSSNRAGTINYNGTNYNAGDPIEGIENLNFPFSYKGTEGGIHKLNFILFDKNNVPVNAPTIELNLSNADFIFSAEETATTAFIDDCVNVNFILDGDTNLEYKMRWNADIQGKFIFNGQTYETNEDIPVENGNFNGCFRGLSKGLSNLVFEVTAGGESKEDSTNITFDDYAIAINSTSNTAELNECTDININLTGTINETYTMTWISDVKGQFTYNGVVYETGEEIRIKTGFTTGCFTGLGVGLTNLTFTVTAFNNPKSETINLTIKSFDFTAVPVSNEAIINECTDININIDGSSNLIYTLNWTAAVSGEFIIDGVSYPTNRPIPLTSLITTGCFKGTSEGESNLKFTLSASGISKDKDVDLNILGFSVSGAPVSPTAFIDECTDINFNIDGANSLTYRMKWLADVEGTFTYNGTSYATNQVFEVPSGQFTGCFNGSTSGVSNLKFLISAVGITKTLPISLTINQFAYTFSVPETLNITAGDPIDFVMLYQTDVPSVNAQIFHDININSNVLTNRQNNSALANPFSLVSAQNTPLRLSYNEIGTKIINWTYTNSLGFSDNYTTTVNVENAPFNLALTSTKNAIIVGETYDYVLSVIPTNSNLSYKINNYRFISGEGNLTYQNEPLQLPLNLITNTVQFNFTPSGLGDIVIEFEIEDNFNQSKIISKRVTTSLDTEFTSTVFIGNEIFCGTQSNENKYRRENKRFLQINNQNETVITDIELTTNGVPRVLSVNVPKKTRRGYQIASCTNGCRFNPGSCTPENEFSIRYLINGEWTPKEDYTF